MTEEQKVEYLPFHAINEFMRDDYRLTVLNEVLSQQDKIAPEKKAIIGKMIAKYVTIQGFRNSNLAPTGRKAKSSVPLFERSADYSAVIIECWKNLHEELAKTVYEVLTEHNWEKLLPLEDDRSSQPGFLVHWPKADTFEVLIKAVQEKAPELKESEDNISLMAVWLGNRLPYDLYEQEVEPEKK
jgi:hypothetical protein